MEPSTWFAFRTEPQKEFIAHAILNRAGFVSYTPIRQEYRFANRFARAKRKKTLKTFPLMVGYIFVALPPEALGWFCYYHKPECVYGVVGFAGAPVEIEHEIILAMAEEHGGIDYLAPDYERFMRTYKEFKPGDRVEIVDGALLGHQVVVEEIEGDQARAIIQMLGKEMQVAIPLMDLEAAE